MSVLVALASLTPEYIGVAVRILLQLALNCPRGAQTCALPLTCDCNLEINPMTLKLKVDLPTFTLKIKLLVQGIRNLEGELEKFENMSEGQRSRSKCQKLGITSSVIVTDIPSKP